MQAHKRSIGDKDITVNINSPGGDVFEGIAIYNELAMHSGKVTVNIIGMAASAASFIAMAGDTVNIGKASYIMIHEAMSGIYGTADEQQQVADYTRKIRDLPMASLTVKSSKSSQQRTLLLQTIQSGKPKAH